MEMNVYATLALCPLFKGIPEREIRGIVHEKNCSIRRYHSGSIVAFRGDRYEELWIVVEGRLRAEFQSHRGKVLKVETLNAKELVASSVLFAPSNFLPVTLTSEEEVKICVIPKREVLRMLQTDSRVLLNYLEDTGSRLSLLAEKLNMLQFSTIREKIAHYLLDEAEKQGSESVKLPLSKEALSEVFGVTRPALSREFSHLCEMGFIQQEGAVIHILDRVELLELIEAP